jgi:hypothetical protein
LDGVKICLVVLCSNNLVEGKIPRRVLPVTPVWFTPINCLRVIDLEPLEAIETI